MNLVHQRQEKKEGSCTQLLKMCQFGILNWQLVILAFYKLAANQADVSPHHFLACVALCCGSG